ARWPKSTTFSGNCANVHRLPVWPLSFDMVAYPRTSAGPMAKKLIAPADPPDPSPWNFPFQLPSDGIQTSKLICDWLVGVATATTRQNAGRLLKTWPLGAVNVPAGTDCAVVIVTFGRDSVARLLQLAALAPVAPSTKAPISATALDTAYRRLDLNLQH